MKKRLLSSIVVVGLAWVLGPMMLTGCGMIDHCMVDTDCGKQQACMGGICQGIQKGTVCTYNGKTYKEGDSFPSEDGCNTCGCSNGTVACTLRACVNTCQYNGKTYKEGDSFPSKDGCNTCQCSQGQVACTEKACPPKQCGGIAGIQCDKGQYCDLGAKCGVADQMGVCKVKPENCDSQYAPVCGCDDKTYSNTCTAASAGVSVRANGECSTKPAACTYEGKTYESGVSFKAKDGCNTCTCTDGKVSCTEKACPPQSCGGLGGATCSKGEYCNQPGHCGSADQTGTCAAIPTACTDHVDPVCGCNGKTYSNACEAAAAGQSVQKKGACNTNPTGCTYDGKTYKDGESFQAKDGCNTCTCNQGRVACTEKACPKTCGGFAGIKCASGEFCDFGSHCGATDQPGTCKAIPQGCTQQVDPVCGCDDNTYSNACMANAAGVSVRSKGSCTSTKTCTYDGKTYNDGDTFKSTDGCNTCSCKGGQVLCTQKACAQSCGSRGLKPCPTGSYCDQPSHCGATDIPGVCRSIPQGCTQQYDPVCGCDNKTYGNACTAAAAGVSVKSKGACGSSTTSCTYDGTTYKDGATFKATDGCNTCTCTKGQVACTKKACPKVCGGLAGIQCNKGEFCDVATHCGWTDQTGFCTAIPSACTKIYQPVCGCDDKTYGNACTANAAGVSVKSQGECKSTKSCTYNGQTYKDGATFTATDGCNTCTCRAGVVGCTKIACPPGACRSNSNCSRSQYCKFSANACSGIGTCTTRPTTCTQQYAPVCGCDGKTYGNACTAAGAGASVQSSGACP